MLEDSKILGPLAQRLLSRTPESHYLGPCKSRLIRRFPWMTLESSQVPPYHRLMSMFLSNRPPHVCDMMTIAELIAINNKNAALELLHSVFTTRQGSKTNSAYQIGLVCR